MAKTVTRRRNKVDEVEDFEDFDLEDFDDDELEDFAEDFADEDPEPEPAPKPRARRRAAVRVKRPAAKRSVTSRKAAPRRAAARKAPARNGGALGPRSPLPAGYIPIQDIADELGVTMEGVRQHCLKNGIGKHPKTGRWMFTQKQADTIIRKMRTNPRSLITNHPHLVGVNSRNERLAGRRRSSAKEVTTRTAARRTIRRAAPKKAAATRRPARRTARRAARRRRVVKA